MTRPYSPAALQALRTPILAMAAVIVLSNVLVQHPINDWLTWGAFSFPVVFLVTDLTNRSLGPTAARRVAWVNWAGPGEHSRPAGEISVALLQTNVKQDEKFSAERMPEMLAWVDNRLRLARADLVVAPETAVPLLPFQLAGCVRRAPPSSPRPRAPAPPRPGPSGARGCESAAPAPPPRTPAPHRCHTRRPTAPRPPAVRRAANSPRPTKETR